jgi:hypothetical protein
MPLRETFFQPTAVIRTDTVTSERTLEIDWTSSMIQDNDHYQIDPEGSDRDGLWLDEIVTDTATWEPLGGGIVSILSLDPVSRDMP